MQLQAKRSIHPLLLVAVLSLAAFPVEADDLPAHAVPTFESMGIYYDRPAAAGGCQVHYRVAGSREWREGYPLVYDARERQYRGSLVQLKPDTPYEIRLEAGGDHVEIQQSTLSDVFPIGTTTALSSGTTTKTLVIRDGGTDKAWHLVTPAPGTKFVSDVFNLSDYNVVVEAEYVILRGLELRNAAIHGVLLRRGIQHVVVEDCHITGWGRTGGALAWGVNGMMDSGIYAESDAGHLVIQRNLIEYPRGGSNDWESGHPNGPQGISFINSRGGNVVRYNIIRSTEDHGFNDGFGGGDNFSFKGSPNRDSDIYGNIISNCWDDCIESEGANMNVRIWSNYIHHSFVDIASAATSMGPLYIFRNVFGASRISHSDPSGGTMLKTGARDVEINGEKVSTALGYRFVFHNTALQPGGPMSVFSSHQPHNAVTRNNIFYARGQTYPKDAGEPHNDFKNDLTGAFSGGLVASMFLESERLEWFLAPTMKQIQYGKIEMEHEGKRIVITDPLVDAPDPAIDKGVRLPGFNDEYAGAAPDIGAFENGMPPLRFGREMAPGFQRAPWELH